MWLTYQFTGWKRQVLISTCNYIGQIVIGFTVAWSGVILPKLANPEQSPLAGPLTDTQQSLVASLLYLACLPGPYLMGWLSNVKGRKPCLLLGGVITSVSYVVLATSTNLAMLYSGRILSGIGTGMIAAINIVYIGEIASTNIRGTLLTLTGTFLTCGAIILYTSSYFLSYSGTNYVGAGINIAFTLATFLIPETPIFYLLKGKDDKVIKILEELGRNEDIDDLLAAKKELQESSAKKDWIELFTLRSNRKALFIVISMNIFQHCSGVMVIILFAGTIFEMAGSSIDSNISMLIISGFQLMGSCVSPFLVDRTGRKILLAATSAICSLSMLLLGIYFYLDHIGNSVVEHIKWFPLAILIIFFIGYDSGLGIIPNALIGEMFTANARSKGSAVVYTVTWVTGFLITTAFGSLVEHIGGHVAFWIFGGICCGAVLFSIFCVLETKGKSLLEIQELLSR